MKKAIWRRAGHRSVEGSRYGIEDCGAVPKYGISEETYYNWKAKFGDMTVSDARRKALEAENGKLERLLAESILDNAALKDIVGRK